MIHFTPTLRPWVPECLEQAPGEALLETHTLRSDGDFEHPPGLPTSPRRTQIPTTVNTPPSLPPRSQQPGPALGSSITNAFDRASLSGSG